MSKTKQSHTYKIYAKTPIALKIIKKFEIVYKSDVIKPYFTSPVPDIKTPQILDQPAPIFTGRERELEVSKLVWPVNFDTRFQKGNRSNLKRLS